MQRAQWLQVHALRGHATGVEFSILHQDTTPGHLLRVSQQEFNLRWSLDLRYSVTGPQFAVITTLEATSPIDQSTLGVTAALDKATLARYEQVRKARKGLAVAELVKGHCVACHMAARKPEAPMGDTKAIRFGTLVTENGAPRRDAVVVIRGDKVVSVGTGDSAVPRGAAVTDLRAFTGIPGLVDVHTHMSFWRSRDNPLGTGVTRNKDSVVMLAAAARHCGVSGRLNATLLADELSRNLGCKVTAEATQRMNPGDIVLAHENDLEGCLVVVQKKGAHHGEVC